MRSTLVSFLPLFGYSPRVLWFSIHVQHDLKIHEFKPNKKKRQSRIQFRHDIGCPRLRGFGAISSENHNYLAICMYCEIDPGKRFTLIWCSHRVLWFSIHARNTLKIQELIKIANFNTISSLPWPSRLREADTISFENHVALKYVWYLK